jgi:hypothetical protein
MQRSALTVLRRALPRVIRQGGPRRLRVTADRGCAAVALCGLLTALRGAGVMRVKKSPKGCSAGVWRPLHTVRFVGKTRRGALGRLRYCAGKPPPLWSTRRRKREAQGQWDLWSLGTNRP